MAKVYRVLRKNACNSRILYPFKLLFVHKNKGQIFQFFKNSEKVLSTYSHKKFTGSSSSANEKNSKWGTGQKEDLVFRKQWFQLICIITLSVNELNNLIKRQKLSDRTLKKKNIQRYAVYRRQTLVQHKRWKKKMEKDILCQQ